MKRNLVFDTKIINYAITGKMFRKAKQNVPEHKFSFINHRVFYY